MLKLTNIKTTDVKSLFSNTNLYYPLISLIRGMLNKDWNVHLQHTLREANACTDWLQNMEQPT